MGGDGNDVTLTAIVGGSSPPGLAGFGPSVEIEQAGPAAVPQVLDGDVVFTDPDNNFNSGTLAVSGLLAEDTVSVLSLGFDPGEFLIDDVAGPVDDLYFEGVLIGVISGGTGATLDVTFNANANANAIDALIQNLTFLDTSGNPTFSRTLSLTVTDAGAGSTGPNPITVQAFDGVIETGGAGDDSFIITGNAHIDAGAGNDTVTFGFRLVDATVSYSGNQVIIDGPSIHTVLSGFETFVFTDGTVDNIDADRLVDDLFYYSRYHDVWNAQVEADAHYHAFGWHEGRDPNAFFSTGIYLGANPDVKAAGVDPLAHFDVSGWQEGRVPSLNFDPAQYLAANPDVAAAHIDPLRHFLEFGAAEGRQPFTPGSPIGPTGFDYFHYLQHNPDVVAAGIDPFQHFQQFGWQEGRNPSALFDVNGYLATYGDVAVAGINPLDHYNTFGWHEGRDPSVGFDTTSYLAAYADVAAAQRQPARTLPSVRRPRGALAVRRRRVGVGPLRTAHASATASWRSACMKQGDAAIVLQRTHARSAFTRLSGERSRRRCALAPPCGERAAQRFNAEEWVRGRGLLLICRGWHLRSSWTPITAMCRREGDVQRRHGARGQTSMVRMIG